MGGGATKAIVHGGPKCIEVDSWMDLPDSRIPGHRSNLWRGEIGHLKVHPIGSVGGAGKSFEVNENRIRVFHYEYVLRTQVAMDDAVVVDELK